MKQGTFITFEGIDGVGKSTQLDLVYQKCLQLGHPVVKTREPGGTELGRGIRRLLLNPGLKNLGAQAELLLYAADRAQHVAEVIVPALKAGKVVLCDRYLDSTVLIKAMGRAVIRCWCGRSTNWQWKGFCPSLLYAWTKSWNGPLNGRKVIGLNSAIWNTTTE